MTAIFSSFGELAPSDIITILTLVLLEGILSADNALVLAVLVKHLPDEEQKRALKYGIIFAYVSRFAAIFVAGSLLQHSWMRWSAAAYLLYVGLKGLRSHIENPEAPTGRGAGAAFMARIGFSPFWQTVAAVELADLAFSVDSITAALAFSTKLAVVFIGGCLGIIAMRFAASAFLTLIQRYPVMEKTAFVLVAIIGMKLLLTSGAFPGVFGVTWIEFAVPIPHWLGLGSVLGIFFGTLAIAHFFPKSVIGRIGRKETAELKEEFATIREINT